jgi:hypothetical protein
MSIYRRILVPFVAASVMLTSAFPSYAVDYSQGGPFYFRYKDGTATKDAKPDDPDSVSKDITAFFVGGVGFEFTETIPMKAEWQDDDWRIVGGQLPAGLSFDAATRTFIGTPTQAMAGSVIQLEGFDTTENSVATAEVTFDIVQIEGLPVNIDIYAHTGKYKVDELSIPAGVTVDKWKKNIYAAPAGVTVNGPYFEGTPSKAGVSPVLIVGTNYMDQVVATFFGKYTVEDGPSFPKIADDVRNLPNPVYYGSVDFDFGPRAIRRSVGDISKVKYYLEVEEGDDLPGNVKYTSSPARVVGEVSQPYETATVRWKAIDTDGAEGVSNWFKFGSNNPSPACSNYGIPTELSFYTNKQHDVKVGQVLGGKGAISYSVLSGSLPTGLTFDDLTGRIIGSPAKKTPDTDFVVQTSVTNDEQTVNASCYYVIKTFNGDFSVADTTASQDRHVRVGDVYKGVLAINGGISDYSTAFKNASDWPDYVITTAPTKNVDKIEVSGVPQAKGAFSIPFVTTNGDENKVTRNLTVNAYGEIAFGQDVPTIYVKRLAESQSWATIPRDASTIIPDVAKRNRPSFVIDLPADLPEGISLTSGGEVSGGTTAVAKPYGPFRVTMQDYSGDTVQSNAFNVVVQDRDAITIASLAPPRFVVESNSNPTVKVITVKQPPLAANFKVTYNLAGPALPDWLSFDRDTGSFTAEPGIPYSAIGPYGPFVITATDDDGSSVSSKEFNVTVTDWDAPYALFLGQVKGTVSGDISKGQVQTTLNLADLTRFIKPETVIGGTSAVKFISSEPNCPANVCFDVANGLFAGVPTSEFNGTVKVTFQDGKGRPGAMAIPMEIKPYPTVAMTKTEYDLSRLSSAAEAGITARQIAGFWNSPTWSVDTTNGTDISTYGLSVNANGTITGKTTAAAGTTISNVILAATSVGAQGEKFVVYTQPFSIEIGNPVPVTLAYSPTTQTYYMKREVDGSYSLVRQTAVVPSVKGSNVAPLTYSVDRANALAEGMPPAINIVPSTGRLSGVPDRLGDWTVAANVADAEARKAQNPVDIRVYSTLDGPVQRSNGGGAYKLRLGEPFTAAALNISNEVQPIILSTTPSTIPASMAAGFDPATGEFTDAATIDFTTDKYVVEINVKDAHGRGFESKPSYTFQVIKPLEMSVATEKRSVASKQYSVADAMDVAFSPKITYQMGDIKYGLSGILPGTLVNKNYDDAGNFLGWFWLDENGISRSLPPTTLPADLPDLLPLDALVFDTLSATLNGIPSKSGAFQAVLTAYDDHADNYIRPTSTKSQYNSASVTVEFDIANADSLIASNTKDSDTLHQYTSTPSISSTVANAAYGRGVTWSAVSGTLPDGITQSLGSEAVNYSGYPKALGTYGNIVWRARDAAGRTANTPAATMIVKEREALELTGENPIYLVVNDTDTKANVGVIHSAYGLTIPKANWTVTGDANIPPGVTYTIADGGVKFEGVATKIGRYEGITIAARDSIGAMASMNLVFEVVNPQGPIILNVSDIRTKVGYPFEMQSTSSNTYGIVRYYSQDISGDLATQMALNGSTGLVKGAMNSVGNLDVDIYVTDSTNRITSKPVLAEIIPDLRVTVPTIVQTQQATAMTRTISTDYVLGTVSYEKGQGTWPDGLVVNPTTGAITAVDTSTGTAVNRVVAAAGDYPGLTIRAVDTFLVAGVTYTDVQQSNSFTVSIEPADILPDIKDPTNLKVVLGTEGAKIADWTPTVHEKGTTKVYAFSGTRYTPSHDLTQYGLKFDKNTGTISGTAHTPFIIRDFNITVMSQRGDTDVTSNFWIGVAPKDAMALSANFNPVTYVRKGAALDAKDLKWDNAIGILTHAKVSGNSAFLVTSGTGKVTSQQTSASWAVGSFPVGIRLTDEFSRTAQITYTITVLPALTITMANFSADPGKQTTSNAPVVAGQGSTVKFTATGLPNGFSVDPATGLVSGILNANDVDADATPMPFVLTVTDLSDNATASVTASIYPNLGGYKYYRVYDVGKFPYWGCMFVDLIDQKGNRINGEAVQNSVWGGTNNRFGINNFTAVSKNGDNCQIVHDGTAHWMQWEFLQGKNVRTFNTWFGNDWNRDYSYLRKPLFQASVDGVTWTTLLTGGSNLSGAYTAIRAYHMP